MNSSPRKGKRLALSVRACLVAWVAALLAIASTARAAPVSYSANIFTELGDPVTNVLILEQDAGGTVHLTPWATDVSGAGLTTIMHDPGFDPVASLLLGVTNGQTDAGDPRVELVTYVDPAFAASALGNKWSDVFVGSRHSVTADNIVLASGGDPTAQAYFTDEFWPGPAAGAAFATGGAFTVLEWSNPVVIGTGATFGNWMITGEAFGPLESETNPGLTRPVLTINEAAKVDLGPFDIEIVSPPDGEAKPFLKTVTNSTGETWESFVIELGTGLGPGFTLSTPADGLGFVELLGFATGELDGYFTPLLIEEDRIEFEGLLAPGETARFVFNVLNTSQPSFTLRQSAVAIPAPAALPVGLLGLLTLTTTRRRRHLSPGDSR